MRAEYHIQKDTGADADAEGDEGMLYAFDIWKPEACFQRVVINLLICILFGFCNWNFSSSIVKNLHDYLCLNYLVQTLH